MSSKDPVFFDECTCLKETDKAILVEIPELEDEKWFPKTTIHEDSEVWKEDDFGRLAVKYWFAEKENLV